MILTDKEIGEAKRGHTAIIYKDGRPPDVFESDRAIAQAEQKNTKRQMIEWGEEPCSHRFVGNRHSLKRECFTCWQELKSR